MSKQSEAKKKQGYETSPKRRMCSNCVFYRSTFDYPKWAKDKGITDVEMEDAGYSKREHNLRCGIGKFAIKKIAVCREHKLEGEE